jgi:hypothetical protein
MARAFLTSVDLKQNQLLNASLQNLAAAPASPVAGQVYYDTVRLAAYCWNGTTWQPFDASKSTIIPQSAIVGLSTTLSGYLPLTGGTLTGGLTVNSTINTGGGIVTLNNGTSNWINYGTTGVAAPSYTTRSAGTKLVLYDSLNSSSADYAIGIASGNLWQSVGVSGNQFQWYGGTTLAATLSGAGALTLNGLSVSGAVNISGFTTLSSGNIGPSGAWFGSNATYTTGWQYVATDFAWFLRSDGATGDVVSLNVAPSGTAGATMTWTPAFSVSQTGAVSFPQTPTGGGITALFASPPTIGGTTPGAGNFTTLNATGLLTISDNSSTLPAAASAGALNWNYTGGSGETDFFNLYASAGLSFAWYQRGAGSTMTQIASLSPTGNFGLAGGLSATTGAFSGLLQASSLSISGASSVQPTLDITGGVTDQKLFDNYTTSTTTSWRFINDAQSAASTWLSAVRSGYAVTSINLNGAAINLSGATTITGATTVNGTLSVNGLLQIGQTNNSQWGEVNIGVIGSFLGGNIWWNGTNFNYIATGNYGWYLRSDGLAADVVSLNVAPASGIAGGTFSPIQAFSVSQTGAVSFPQTPTGGGITALFASPPTIGGTTAGAAAFTTLTTSGTVTAPTVSTNSLGAVAANIAALNASSGNVLNTVGRNRLDNGDCEVAQRTLPVTVAGAYHLDRWASSWSAGTASISQGAAAGYASRKQISAVFTGLTVGATATVVQRIESARSFDLAGQSVTVSVNAAYTVSAGSTTFQFTLFYPSVTDNFATLTTIGSATFTPSGTPGTYSAYFAVPSAATTGLEIQITATQAGATGTLTLGLTTLQLEAGTTATQFERVDPVLQLLRCQRYFQLYLNLMTFGYTTSGGSIISEYLLPVEMRASPVAAISAATYSNATTLGTNYLSQEHLRMQVMVTSTGTGWGAGTVALSADL